MERSVCPDKWTSDEEKCVEDLRTLRNTLAHSPQLQKKILDEEKEGLISFILLLSEWVKKIERKETCVRLSLQFLGNLIVNSEPGRQFVWECFGRDLWTSLLLSKDTKCTVYTSALFYNCILSESICEKVAQGPEFILLVGIIGQFLENDNECEREWDLFIVQKLWATPGFTKTHLSNTTNGGVLCVFLEVADAMLTDSTKNSPLSVENAEDLVEMFVNCGVIDWSLPQESWNEKQIWLFRKLLSILSHLTSQTLYVHLSLARALTTAGENLTSIVKLSKLEDSPFVPNTDVDSIANRTATGGGESESPVFQLKVDLVRFLGNCCGLSLENRKLVGETGLIPVILDCSPLEAENPFITQWVIMAVRNLCKDCPENQAVIAGLSKEGVVKPGSAQSLLKP